MFMENNIEFLMSYTENKTFFVYAQRCVGKLKKNTINFYSVRFISFVILVYRYPGLTKSGASLAKWNEAASTANGERERERAVKAEALYVCFRSLMSPIYW